ncbi:uncharacterized protein LOC143811475 [Ranitomeya variabilis]|uniref:uncharacterized protein LOC143811475 n=1 Tax=Ranitomeya variabilis TaxID=490064 RepID=UPI004057553E
MTPSDVRAIIREEMQGLAHTSSTSTRQPSRSRSPVSSESEVVQKSSDEEESQQSSSEYEGGLCLPNSSVDSLIKAVRSTMGCPDEKGKKSGQDIMFAGLGQRKRRSFPTIPTIKELVKKEWEKQHTRGFLPSSAKRRYPFSDEELSSWQKIPKVDAAVASTSKQSVLPVEDSGTLTDPLDRKAEALLKRSWEANTGAFRPAIASTCTARSLLVWTEQLEEQIRGGASRNTILSKIPLMKDAVAFLADASVDSLRLTARSAGLVNTARRALWLKNWKGDAQAKAKLCAIPCQGELSGDAPSPGINLLSKGSAGRQRIQNKKVLCFPDPITKNATSTVNYEVGGRLKYFSSKWKLITSSPWILDIIGNGLKLEFDRIPWDSFIVTSPRGQQQQEALESEILSLLSKKVLIEVPRDQEGRGFYSPLFLINKPDGSFRTIINLKKLNSFLRNHTFKMESISSTIKLLFPRCVMAGIDLKDAYYHLPIHAEHQQYLRVAVILEGQVRHFQYVAMPFGLSMAPRIFTKVMLEVMAHLRQRDTLIIPYLDDFLVVGNSVAQCKLRLSNTISSLQELGWIINFEKSRLNPDTTQMFLGIQLDSVSQKSFLPHSKKRTIQSKVSEAIKNPYMTLRKAMSLLGSLSSCIPAVPWAQFHTRQLQFEVLSAQGRVGHLESKLTLSRDVIESLSWWLDMGHLSGGVPWIIDPSRIITTDASPTGWGAHMEDDIVQDTWNQSESSCSSNWKELTAVGKALNYFLPQIQGADVRVFSDNSTTVAYVNRQGGTRSGSLMTIAGEIFQFAEAHLASLTALHIRGIENTKADYLSRNRLRQGEWSLNRAVFRLITKAWGVPQIDLFATRGNRQVERFASLNSMDHPDMLDSLHHPWNFKLAYAFPPMSLIPLVIRKIRREQARIILIAPFWPKRPWFSCLQSMCLSDPWILPLDKELLFQGPFFHPQVKGLHLTAWNLSGNY